ncbi:nicotinate dehydrogenase FAD-subunit [Peptococcaceae bacterium CEB3]|nr:nicotinate dehydrogenase FAD-subunit [Peptococcaceae bacterium CEB3]
MPAFRLVCPSTLGEALAILADLHGEIIFLNGGTDLILQLKEGSRRADWLVDLSQLDELNYIQADRESIRIGGTTTFATTARSPLLWEEARCLAQAAAQVGSTQIRNRATLAGNIVTASAAGDSLPALLVLGAEVGILGPLGRRRVSLAQFLAEPGPALQRGEFIAEIELPRESGRGESWIVSAFGKVGSRSTVTIARLNMAVRLEAEAGDGRIQAAGVALGALGKTPFRTGQVERKLAGCQFSETLGRDLAEWLTAVVDEAIPGRYSQAYKREAIRGLAYDVWGELLRQAVGWKSYSSLSEDRRK